MFFESRWVPDRTTLDAALLEEAAEGAWVERGMGALEPSLAWVLRLLQAHPARGDDVAGALLTLALDGPEGAAAVSVLLATAGPPALLELAAFLAARLPTGEAQARLREALPSLEAKARGGAQPLAMVWTSPEPAVRWLDGPETLAGLAMQSAGDGQPRLGGHHPLDWLAALVPQQPWVAAALPAVITALLAGTATQAAAALRLGAALGRRGRLAPLWRQLVEAAPPWLDQPLEPNGPTARTVAAALAAG